LERLLDKRSALCLTDAPGVIAPIRDAIAHAAKANPRHLQACATELHILHGFLSCWLGRTRRRLSCTAVRIGSRSSPAEKVLHPLLIGVGGGAPTNKFRQGNVLQLAWRNPLTQRL